MTILLVVAVVVAVLWLFACRVGKVIHDGQHHPHAAPAPKDDEERV